MAYFPQFSNFKDYVQSELNKRRGIRPPGSPLPPDYNATLEVSKLNAWVRLTSAVGDGLVIESNPNDSLFRAAGQSTGIYDGAGGTATIGKDWKGRSVSADSGGRLRPRPVVTSVEVDEGAGNISRKATISITAFSKEQMEKVCEYFLEPGYTVFLEFGWNTTDSLKGLVSPINETNVANMQNFDETNKRRSDSRGYYENYLGYITGGSVSVDGGNWTISVNLTGFPELPFYLQTGPKTESERKEEKNGSTLFSVGDIRYENDIGKKRFKQFYNALTSERRTSSVKKLQSDKQVTQIANFINFDDNIKNSLNGLTSGTTFFGLFTIRDARTQTDAGTTRLEAGTKIVGDERFVRMETLMKVLTMASADGFKVGNKTVKINFDISNTIIGAFPNIFSLDKTKLFIPNSKTPNFSFSSALKDEIVQGTGTTDNSIGGAISPTGAPYSVTFPANITLRGNIQKGSNQWGYLKDLYVNIDFFNSIVSTKNFSLKDVLYNLLNGLSSAVNSYWNFQIQEAPDSNGNINLEIVDLNFTSQTTKNNIYEFTLSGEDSIFIESSFDMDIGGAMMNQIIGKRLSFSTQKDLNNIGIFTDKDDKILKKISENRSLDNETSPTTGSANDETEDEITKRKISEFLNLIGMYPKVKIDKVDEKQPIETYLYKSIYNDSNLLNSKKDELLVESGDYSPLLPIRFSFTIHGISGIQRGDKFKVRGIPKTFYDKGFFQVTSIKHIVDGMMWKTQVEGQFRNTL